MKIKLSNKILLTAGAVPVLFIIVMFFALRFFPWGDVNSLEPLSGTSGMITRTFALEGFSEISIKGVWKVNLIQGDSFLVNISARGSDMDKIIAEREGNRLVLDLETDFKRSGGSRSITAAITLPSVSSIDMDGVTTVNLSGLEIDSVSIRSEGVANLSGDKGMIRDLAFKGNGVTRIQLSAVPITNADLQCEGVYAIGILMNGGKLSGIINGMGTFDYQGDVSANELMINGSVNNMAYQTR